MNKRPKPSLMAGAWWTTIDISTGQTMKDTFAWQTTIDTPDVQTTNDTCAWWTTIDT